MMGSCRETEDDQFFDTPDELNSLSEDCSTSGLEHEYQVSDNFGYELWAGNLESVNERRDRFLRWMGLSPDWHLKEKEDWEDIWSDESKRSEDRIEENSVLVPANSDTEDGALLSQSSSSCRSNEPLELLQSGTVELLQSGTVEETNADKMGSFDDGSDSFQDEPGQDELVKRLFEMDADRLAKAGEFQRTLFSSSKVQRSPCKEAETSSLLDRRKKVKKGWLQKLSIMARSVDRQEETISKPSGIKLKAGERIQTVRVHSHKKRSKELSSLYTGQEFSAHKGSILTMKFSLDGQYLASAGEDGIVRVWKVIEDNRPSETEICGTNPSSLYFSTNHLSELAPLDMHKDNKTRKITRFRKPSESACVIFPPKVFGILEKPVHEFYGHGGEILALSWSKRGYLLSSSVDKTVRMWRIGQDQCLKIFSHNNYVTCIEFNPVDENCFISGSIDGKVRIWEVHGCQVIDWIDIREIVTAVCYRPNGKGGIVGSMDGTCRFYDIIDNRLRLDAQVCLMGKKKLAGKRITGFEFCPSDSNKVIVTSADSQVRILCGVNVLCKFKGSRSSGTNMSAFFTSDGKHIISAAEDSNVHVWNHISSDQISSKPKSILSYESFLSQSASIAIPWCGMQSIAATLPSPTVLRSDLPRSTIGNGDLLKMPLSSPLGRAFSLEALCKGSPTWPAEKLPDSSQVSVSPSMRKSQYRFLKSAYQSTFTSPHMWGLVIVTAGWDGQIRTFLNYGLPLRL